VVYGHEELMMISAGGIVIRTPIETISEHAGRSTSGVILMRLQSGDRLAAIALLEPSPNGDQPDEPESESLADVPIDAEEPEVSQLLATEGTYDPDEEAEAQEAEEEE
jgi:DNA gyrase subunit A